MPRDLAQIVKEHGALELHMVKDMPENLNLTNYAKVKLERCNLEQCKKITGPAKELEIVTATLNGDLDLSGTQIFLCNGVNLSNVKSIKSPSERVEFYSCDLPSELDLSKVKNSEFYFVDLTGIKKGKLLARNVVFNHVTFPKNCDMSNIVYADFTCCDLLHSNIVFPKSVRINSNNLFPAKLDLSAVTDLTFNYYDFDGVKTVIWPKNGTVKIEPMEMLPKHIKKSYETWKMQRATNAITSKNKKTPDVIPDVTLHVARNQKKNQK